MLTVIGLSSCEKNNNNNNGNEPVKEANPALIVSNCENELKEDKSLGTGGLSVMTAITKIASDKLAANGSTEITAIRAGILNSGKECKAFIRKELDGENVVEVPFEFNRNGWSIAKLQDAYKITEGEDLYVGYEIVSPDYCIAYNGTEKSEDKIGLDGKWIDLSSVVGKGWLAIQLIAEGGDYSTLENQHDAIFSAINMPSITNTNKALNLKAYVGNNGIQPIKSLTISGDYDGQSISKEVKNLNIKTGEYAEISLDPITTPSTAKSINYTVEANITEQTDFTPANNKLFGSQTLLEGTYPRNQVLIEQFTGQSCGYCPGGAAALNSAIQNMYNPEQFCWVAHHDGYYTDSFTIKESSTITKSLGINGAPSLSINRAKYNSKLFTHPGYIKSRDLNKVAKIGSSSTIEMKHTYDKATRELKVTVSGECNEIAANITVLIMQSGIKATQAGGGADYEHNFAPRAFLTAAMGDKLELKDRKYSKSYTLTVPEKVGDYNVVLENVDVVSFITRNGRNAKNSPVLNTDMAPLIEGASSVNATDILRNYFEQTPEFSILKYCRQ